MDGRTDLSRRALLGLAAVVPLVACTSDPSPDPAPDPDDLLRQAAVLRERALLQEYDAVLLTLPALAPRLVPLRAEHAQHLAALDGAEPSPAPSAAAVASSRTTTEALRALVAAERGAAAAHGQAALAASRALAGVLASLSASEASHPVALA
jgi:hypothetical protein